MTQEQFDMSIEGSRLYKDLHLDHRDAMYRAMVFIARQGGPPLSGDAREALVAHRGRARDWLSAQGNHRDLFADYERFLQAWNPIFRD